MSFLRFPDCQLRYSVESAVAQNFLSLSSSLNSGSFFFVSFISYTRASRPRLGQSLPKRRRGRRHCGSGRHGQIRTADLSLRRRPLYPSELRAHSVPIVPFDAAAANVVAVVHAVEVNLFHGGVGVANCLAQVAAARSDSQD